MTVDSPRQTCLLIHPRSFHAVARSFREALVALGFDVTEANEEYPESIVGKLLGKVDSAIGRRITERTIRRRFLAGQRYDLAVIVKGRGISEDFAREIGRHADRTAGYQYDALDYDPSIARWCGAVDRMATFDYRDAALRGWPVVELFCQQPPANSPSPPRYRISAIMRNHSHRIAFLDQVIRALGPGDDFVYVFEKSRLGFLLGFLRSPGSYWRWRKHVHFTPLPYDRYIAALQGSAFTLDYAHPRQRGATMRSFEALAMGVRIVTNNPGPLAHSPYFSADNTILADGDLSGLEAAMTSCGPDRPHALWRSAVDCVAEITGLSVARAAV